MWKTIGILSVLIISVFGAPTLTEKGLKKAQCGVCQAIVEDLSQHVSNENTQGHLQGYLDKLCSGQEHSILCKTVVDGYSEELFQLLSKELDPERICQLSKLCEEESYVESDGLLNLIEEIQDTFEEENPENSKECEICKMIVNFVDKYIESNRTIGAINATLEKLCNSLPGEIGDLCKQFEPDLIKVIKDGLEPEKACEKIKMCKSDDKKKNKAVYDIQTEKEDEYEEEPYLEDKRPVVKLEEDEFEEEPYLGDKRPVVKLEEDEYEEEPYIEDRRPVEKIPEDEEVYEEEPRKHDRTHYEEDRSYLDDNRTQRKVELVHADRRVEDSTACEACKLIVREVDKLIENNATIDKINATLTKVCDKLPGEAGKLCKKYEAELIQAMAKGLDPEKVCEKIKLCNSTALHLKVDLHKLVKESSKLKDSTACETCKLIVREVDKLIENNATIDKINATLTKVCDKLPGEAGKLCKKYEAELIQAMAKGLDPEKACEKIKLCNSTALPLKVSLHKLVKESSKLKDSTACETCKLIVREVDKLIENNATIDKINATLTKVCDKLPGEAGKLCKKYEAELIQAMAKGLDPEKACEKIKLCNSTALPLKVSLHKLVKESSKLKDSTACEACKLIVREVDKLIENNATIDKINATLTKVCDKLPGEAGKLCKKYEAELIQAMAKGLDPEKACEKIKLCNSTAFPLKLDLQKLVIDSSKLKDSTACEACKLIVREVDKLIENNATIDKINATLTKLCDKLPGEAGKLCKKYEAELIQAMAKGLDPEKACEKIKLCNQTSVHVIPKVDLEEIVEEADKLKASKKCEICQLIIESVDKIIENNRTIAAINATLEKLCSILPGEAGKLCKEFEPKLIKVLEKGLDPKTACEEIKMCNKTRVLSPKALAKEYFQETMETANELQGSTECEICKFIIQTLDNLIDEENSTLLNLNATLERLCNKLPGKVGEVCRKSEAYFIFVLEKGLNPKEACELIKMCKEKASKPVYVEPGEVEEYKKLVPETGISVVIEYQENIFGLSTAMESTKCTLCKFIITALDRVIDENKTEAEINATLTKICTVLPNEFGDICRAYQNEILKILEKGFQPDKVCEKMKLCKNGTSIHYSSLELTCDACYSLVEYTAHHENIEEVFQAVCKPLCHNRVRRSAIGNHKNRVNKQVEIGQSRIYSQQDSQKRCEVCEFIVTAMSHYIDEKEDTESLSTLVYKLCNKLPMEFKEECSEFAPRMMEVLKEDMDPKTACAKINACSNTDEQKGVEVEEPEQEFDEQEVGDAKCLLCKATMESVCQDIDKKSDEILAKIDNFCNHLPEPTKDANSVWQKCHIAANNIIPFLRNTVFLPEEMCFKIGACSHNPQPVY